MPPTDAANWISVLIQTGGGAAALIVMFRFLTHMREVRQTETEERKEERQTEAKERQEERQAAEKRADAQLAVFLAHNRDIAARCEERTETLVGQVIEAKTRQEAALRELVREIRETRSSTNPPKNV